MNKFFRYLSYAAVALVLLVAGGLLRPYIVSSFELGEKWGGGALDPSKCAGARKLDEKKRQLVESQAEKADLLRSLGYVDGSFDPEIENRGVIVYDEEKASPGVNFYSSRADNGAYLISMKGEELYRWTIDSGPWQHAELMPDGGVLVMIKDERLFRLDKDSNLLWEYRDRVHHDLGFDDEGNIYVLSRSARRLDEFHSRLKTLEDRVVILSKDGEKIEEVSVLELFRNSPYAFLIPAVYKPEFDARARRGRDIDIFHTNHIEVFDGRLEPKSPLFKKGNWLISIRNINTIAIVDGQTREIVWIWGPTNLIFQHHPILLDNGHILLFDNGRSRSEVVELDPLTKKIVWKYGPRDGFFSKTRGSVQRLPNGNTLITQSDNGYVFEVTPEGKVVWKFANPDVNKRQQRIAIWRMTRFQLDTLSFLPPETRRLAEER